MMTRTIDNGFIEEQKKCSYFNDKLSDIEYKIMDHCSSSDAFAMLERGWRRFGQINFVPVCRNCTECVSIRIDVKNYKFTQSDKRVFKKNNNTDFYIQKPSMSVDHLALYNKYHSNMLKKKHWPHKNITPGDYYNSYVDASKNYGREILYIRDDKLIAVAICDFFTKAISSTYCYYDHDYESLSLGKYSILLQIDIAKQNNIPYLYLGYWIKDHYSMGYKDKYKPFEHLVNRPSLTTKPIWSKYE